VVFAKGSQIGLVCRAGLVLSQALLTFFWSQSRAICHVIFADPCFYWSRSFKSNTNLRGTLDVSVDDMALLYVRMMRYISFR
jgi:hypothetical protein